MRIFEHSSGFTLYLSRNDTTNWASRPGARWPCSALSGRALKASFDSNGLWDVAVDGKGGVDVPIHEFNACVGDAIRGRVRPDNPGARFFI